jgi:hypothetical protein
VRSYVPAMIFASWMGTYADLIMVNKHLYSFPVRPFPHVFTINIAFTLVLLPVGTAVFLFCAQRISTVLRALLIVALSIVMTFVEPLAERLGLFVHSDEWHHLYTFFGYLVFLSFMWKIHQWLHLPR